VSKLLVKTFALVFCLLILLSAGCAKKPNPVDVGKLSAYNDYLAKYNAIKMDMDYDDVKAVMGREGIAMKDYVKSSPAATPSHTLSVPLNAYVWFHGEEIAGRIEVSVLFTPNGSRVLTKSFHGLYVDLLPSGAFTTADKFKQISKGMTYDKVVTILGSNGFLISSSTTKVASTIVVNTYAWWPEGTTDPIKMMTIMFQNGIAKVVEKVD
jgi:hypothetical protein